MKLHELEHILTTTSTHSTVTDVTVKIDSEAYFISNSTSIDGNFVLELFPSSPAPTDDSQIDINDLLNLLNLHPRHVDVFALFESLFPINTFSIEGTSLVLFAEPLKIGDHLFCYAPSQYDFSSDDQHFVGTITDIKHDTIILEHVVFTECDLSIPVDYDVLLMDSFIVKRGPHRVIRQVTTEEFSIIQSDTKRFLY